MPLLDLRLLLTKRCEGGKMPRLRRVWSLVGAISNSAYSVQLETAPTGPGENIELPIDYDPILQTNSLRYICQFAR